MRIALSFLLLLSLSFCINAQFFDAEIRASEQKLEDIKKKPLSYWIEMLSAKTPGERRYAAKSIAILGPDAAEAVPFLAGMTSEKDEMIRDAVYEALVRIANADDGSSAAKLLIGLVARNPPNSLEHEMALRSIVRIYNERAGVYGPRSVQGWPGVYEKEMFQNRRWHPPVISPDGKNYTQTLTLEMMGDMTQYAISETLAKGPAYAELYSDLSLRKGPVEPRVSYAGKRKVIFWNLNKGKPKARDSHELRTTNTRTVVVLGADKYWISEHKGSYSQVRSSSENDGAADKIEFPAERLAFFDRAEAALENPPRAYFSRSLELFQRLKKGLFSYEVLALVGIPDKMYPAGNIALAVYEMPDGATITLRYVQPHPLDSWRLEYASRTRAGMHREEQAFIK